MRAVRASRVAWVGAQRDVLAGDLRGTIVLAELQQRFPHLYALGPLAGLTGEISIFDGVPFIARIREGSLVIDRVSAAEACFLVYADVAAWHWTTMDAPLHDEDIVACLAGAAAERGLRLGSGPLVFALRGVTSALTFHVLDKRDGLPHSPARHEEAKVRFALRNREVEVIGFHSTAHRGIFTPGDADIHMHFRTVDGGASGHVEHLALQPGARLGLAVEPGT